MSPNAARPDRADATGSSVAVELVRADRQHAHGTTAAASSRATPRTGRYVGTVDVDGLRAALVDYPPTGSARTRLLRRTVCAVALAAAADVRGSTTVRDVARRMRLGQQLVATLLDELVSAGVVQRSGDRVRVRPSSAASS